MLMLVECSVLIWLIGMLVMCFIMSICDVEKF